MWTLWLRFLDFLQSYFIVSSNILTNSYTIKSTDFMWAPVATSMYKRFRFFEFERARVSRATDWISGDTWFESHPWCTCITWEVAFMNSSVQLSCVCSPLIRTNSTLVQLEELCFLSCPNTRNFDTLVSSPIHWFFEVAKRPFSMGTQWIMLAARTLPHQVLISCQRGTLLGCVSMSHSGD
jgi:hypothetical protein